MQFSIMDLWIHSGWIARSVIIILFMMSIWSFYVMIEKFLAYRKSRKQSMMYLPQLIASLEKDKIEEAINSARKFKDAHIAKVVNAGLLEYQSNGGSKSNVDSLDSTRRALEMAMAVTSAEMKKGLGGLGTIGSTAPFIGLFGTVFGIINAFQGIATAGSGGLAAVSAGIAEALITTGVGIGVAIIAVVAFNFFTERLERFQVEMTNASQELVDYVMKKEAKQIAK